MKRKETREEKKKKKTYQLERKGEQ